MPLGGGHQRNTAHLDKVFGLPVKVGCKVIEDLNEAGADGFPLGLRIFQSLHAITLSAENPQKPGPFSIHMQHCIMTGMLCLLGNKRFLAVHHAGGSAGCC